MKELMEIWLESFENFCRTTSILSEAWSAYHSSSPYAETADDLGHVPVAYPYAAVAQNLEDIAITIDEKVRPAVFSTFHAKCIMPVNSILSLVPPLNENHLQRKALLNEFDSYRLKMEKEFSVGRDSTHPNVMRKAVKLDESAKKLHSVQGDICQKLYEFEVARSQTLGPEMAVFISCLYSYSATLHNSISEMLPVVPQCASSLAAIDAACLAIQQTPPHQVGSHPRAVVAKTVEPVFSRSIYEGGAMGGFGVVGGALSGNGGTIVKDQPVVFPDPSDLIERPSVDTSHYSGTSLQNESIYSMGSRPVSEFSDLHLVDNPVSAPLRSRMPSDGSDTGSVSHGNEAAVGSLQPPPPKPPRKTRIHRTDNFVLDCAQVTEALKGESNFVDDNPQPPPAISIAASSDDVAAGFAEVLRLTPDQILEDAANFTNTPHSTTETVSDIESTHVSTP